MSRETMQQALDRFEHLWEIGIDAEYKVDLMPEIRALRAELAKPEQEPRKEWVGLTDDDVAWADGHSHGNTTWTKQKAFSRAIEAKLKEKNT